jgi:hypothetical protein
MAKSHTWVGVLPGSFSCLHKWHARCREDEEGAILALRQRDRVRRVRLDMPAMYLQRLIMVVDEEYPILEYLVILEWTDDNSIILMFPETLQAPHLHHLTPIGFSLPISS